MAWRASDHLRSRLSTWLRPRGARTEAELVVEQFGGLAEVGSGPDDAASRGSVFASVRFVMTGRCPVERILAQGETA